MEATAIDRASAAGARTLYVAIELSRSGWLAAVLRPEAQRASRHQLKAAMWISCWR